MSLIEKMRSSTDSASTRFIIGMVVLMFVVVGGGRSARGGGCSGGMAATVNGETVPLSEYEHLFRRVERNVETDAERASLSKKVLDMLVQQHAILQEADRLGITVSPEEVAREIRRQSIAQKDGKFDEETYLAALQENGYDRASFEVEIHDRLLLTKMQDLISEGAVVTDVEAQSLMKERMTTLEASYFTLPPEAFYADVTVSDADRDAYLTSHADTIEARYKADYDAKYNLPKRYSLHTIFFRKDVPGVEKAEVQARAEAVATEAHAPGADFAALATRWSEHPTASPEGDLGTVAVDALDPLLVSAADAAGVGNLTTVVETVRGFQVLKVDAIAEAEVISLEKAKPDIAVQMLKDERVAAVIDAYAGKMITEWSANPTVPPGALAAAKSLQMDETGEFKLGRGTVPGIAPMGGADALFTALRAAKTGDVLAKPVTLHGVDYVVRVTRRDDPSEEELKSSAAMARLQLLQYRKAAYFEAWAAQLVKASTVQYYINVGGAF